MKLTAHLNLSSSGHLLPGELIDLPCLSVWQPWAWCLLEAGKDVENRVWAPPAKLIGHYFAIHAAQRTAGFEEVATDLEREMQVQVPFREELPFGKIVGAVFLNGVGVSASRWAASGQCHWRVSRPVRLAAPIPYRGLQKLFTLEARQLNSERAQTINIGASPLLNL